MSIRLSLIALMASATITPASAQTPAARPAPAANAPQPIPRTAFMQRIDSVFVVADANKDGFADRAELEAVQVKELNGRKAYVIKQREAAFRSLDKDNNGSLSLAEFNAVVAAQPIKTDTASVLGRFDTNKDGKVSLAENRAPALTQFDRADTNKDGSLSVAEQKATASRR
ncbi:MAG: EF-hand domain-containing protein [Sphingomonas bacterium]|nr:EF-hand domain-containing protein [Sphingomonas bacterium]